MGIPMWMFYTVFNSVFGSIGVAVAYFAIYPATATADAKIATVASLDLGWVYLGAFVMKVGILVIGINLGGARAAAKVEVPDQQCYQVKGAEGSKLGCACGDQRGLRFSRSWSDSRSLLIARRRPDGDRRRDRRLQPRAARPPEF
jgi:hypothetical protein